ncbi:pyridoxamine 5'-phosphate oxidase family protein [Nocardioides rubriscoriae]|uniref:pyridoxamine 5'-phosphate oxidase family protein n=1 Tax=Nocardioides rubriscoriae TaxID=642762 RepID=UPI0011DF63BE|nr:pyridoxamine 5'-phosphate oxidase family protein [Nocardioides rubriscoriae]
MRTFKDPTVLARAECDRLLRAGILGRMALTTPGGPEIVPVHYRVWGDEVVIRTRARTLLARWAHQAQVAFEVDLVSHECWAGWSVVARGVAVVTPDDVGGAGEETAALVRLPWTSLSGHQLGCGWDAQASMPVRTTSL